MEKERCAIIVTMVILIAIATIGFVYTVAHGTTLSLEAPPPPALFLNGTSVNLTADDLDRDLTIDPTDDLPPNGTQIMSTVQATDIDINTFPPTGISVLIQNKSITVTNHSVWVGEE